MVLVSAVAAIALPVLNGVLDSDAGAGEHARQKLQTVQDYAALLRQRRLQIRDLLLTQPPGLRQPLAQQHADLVRRSIDLRHSLLKRFDEPSLAEFTRLNRLATRVTSDESRIVDLALAERDSEALDLLNGDTRTHTEQLQAFLEHLSDLVLAARLDQLEQTRAQAKNARAWIWGLYIAAILSAPLAAFYLVRERKRFQEDLQRLASLPTHSPNIVLALGAGAQVHYANPRAIKALADLTGSGDVDLLLPPNSRRWVDECLNDGFPRDNIPHALGERRWNITFQPLPEQGLVHAYFTDVTESEKAKKALYREKEHAQVTLRCLGEGVIATDPDGRIAFLNPIAERITGVRADTAVGQPLNRVVQTLPQRDGIFAELHTSRTGAVRDQAMLQQHDGGELLIEYTTAPINDDAGESLGMVIVLRDVSHDREMAERLAWQATHDPLTGLVNRGEFEHRLQLALAGARERDAVHTLLYLDLDQFKVVNDTCGHMAGDELLKQLTRVLETGLRKHDTLARLGGDEFGVLLQDCTVAAGQRLAEGLRREVADFRFAWRNRSFEVGASIGLVEINREAASLADLLRHADLACYAAKDQGRNRVHAFVPGDAEMIRRHSEMHWVERIRKALDENRLVLYAQTIAPNATFDAQPLWEILLRMRAEDGTLLPPGAFLPAAERYGLMPQIDRWVTRQVLLRLSHHEGELAPRHIAINLSGASLGDEEFLAFLRRAFDLYGVEASTICFEITESAAIANLSNARRLIAEMRELGCHFALDDFGSGLSSFGYLKNLPVDYLKIDGSFVRDMARDRIDAAMVQAINEVGHLMGLATVAEFVEDRETREALRRIGVDYVQGLAIGQPQPLEDLLRSRPASGGARIIPLR
ncbi:MAG: EAL domain-containing protein [Chromatiales bacterium]|nr:EAL domain-containing protein [Chromatiales bacterium]